MFNIKNEKGFTLIELIMVTIILGVLSAVAIPRYMGTVANAEEAVEDAIISSVLAGLETYAIEQMFENGRKSWPDNPFDGLESVPASYDSTNASNADSDDEWTFNTTNSTITHQRRDNSRWSWSYDKGTQTGDDAGVGSIGSRTQIQ
jgi:prepilin-type N-terminal cleavage/methylation domain-containing protein